MLERERGSSLRSIASILRRNVSTISRELQRNRNGRHYNATDAANAYHQRRSRCVKPRKIETHPALQRLLESRLIGDKWSPEQCSAYCRREYADEADMQVSHETIYSHIYAHPRGELRKLWVDSLRRSKSKRGPRGSKDSCYSSLKIAEEQRIDNRPEEINSRCVAGHWEGDLIVGKMNQSCVGTLVERKTGYVVLSKMQSKSAQHVREGFTISMSTLPSFLRLSLTYDRGAEMAQHPVLSKQLDFKIYFADRNAPWQRGSSENANGLLRQFLPKGTDLSLHSQEELDKIALKLNHRPRKRFDFRSPQEMMEKELPGGLLSVALDS